MFLFQNFATEGENFLRTYKLCSPFSECRSSYNIVVPQEIFGKKWIGKNFCLVRAFVKAHLPQSPGLKNHIIEFSKNQWLVFRSMKMVFVSRFAPDPLIEDIFPNIFNLISKVDIFWEFTNFVRHSQKVDLYTELSSLEKCSVN